MRKMTLSQALLVTSRNPAVRVFTSNKSYDYFGLLQLISGSRYDKINTRKYVIDPLSGMYSMFNYKTCKEILKSNPDLRIKGLGNKSPDHGEYDATINYYDQSYSDLIFWEQDKGTKLNPENKNIWTLDKDASTEALEKLFKEQGIL